MYKVQVLLSTYNGEAYIKEQLDSILNQEDVSVRILIRDDGSTDSTKDILRAYTALHKNVRCIHGENAGVTASFFRLFELCDSDIDFYALADQDDVWDLDKLKIACSKLEELRSSYPEVSQIIPGNDYTQNASHSGNENQTNTQNNKSRKKKNKKKNQHKEQPTPVYDVRSFPVPLLYCADALNTDENLNPLPDKMQTIGQAKIPDFRNALIENIARGASIVFNKALMSYIRISMPENVYMHDWWLYLVASCFGEVYYDSDAHYKYRQHTKNVLGAAAPSGISKLTRRLRQSKTNGGHVSKQAQSFARIYRVPEDKQLYLNIVTKYQDVKKYRKMGMSGEYLFRQDEKDNKIFKLMFRSNHL